MHTHLKGIEPFGIVDAQNLLGIFGDWKDYLKQAVQEPEDEFVKHSGAGSP